MRHAVLALAPCIVIATAASAAGPKIYVSPYGVVGPKIPADLSAQTASLISTELGNQKALEILKGPSLAGSSGPAADSADAKKKERGVKRAEALVGLGDAAMRKLDFSGAASKYRAAVKLFLQNLVAVGDFGRINYTRLSLATALFRAGEEDAGEKALADVVRLDPERTLDPALYPPVFVRTYQKIQKQLLRKTRGAISVLSTPAGAEVSLDGQKVGVTPILIKDLIRGTHHVSLRSGGAAPWISTVKVTPTKVASLDADLGGKVQGPVGALVRSLGRGKIDRKTLASLDEVASTVKATQVIFGALERRETAFAVKSYLYVARSKKIVALPEMSFDFDMLGGAIEVFKLAGEIPKIMADLPEALALPQAIFDTPIAPAPGVAEVSAAPATAPVSPTVQPSRYPDSGPIQPARRPMRGPVMPAGGPVMPREATPPPRTRQRDALPEGPVRAGRQGSGPGAPILPVRPASGESGAGPITPVRERVPERERQVGSLTERRRLEATDLQSGPRYSAVDINEIVIPKDELKAKKGWPWWAWTLTGAVVLGAIGGGGYYAYDRGILSGPADTAAVTFQW